MFSSEVRAGRGAILFACLLFGVTGCVETSVYDKAAAQLELAGRANQQKDQQLRALEWQVVSLGQQFRESAQRSEATQREIWGQLQQAAAANAALQERLKKSESERASLASNVVEEAAGGAGGKQGAQLRPDELRRLLAGVDARNAQLLERINHLEQHLDQLILSRATEGGTRAHPRPEPGVIDVVDPWGFGSRK